MKGLRLHDLNLGPDSLRLEEVDLPEPRRGEVLIKVLASPVNPSDLLFLAGQYGERRPLPAVPGLEGCGVVVKAGSGLMAWRLVGKRVAFLGAREGAWAEYTVSLAIACTPLPDSISDEQGSMFFVNPMTALAMIQIAKQRRAGALIHTASASAVGQLLQQMAMRAGLPVIHVVRRAESVERLKGLGAAHVLDSSAVEFDAQLKELARKLGGTVAFDAVAGAMTGQLLRAMKPGSQVYVYGALSGLDPAVPAVELLFRDKSVQGFYLGTWAPRHPLAFLRMQGRLKRWLSGEIQTPVRMAVPLAGAPEAISAYRSAMSDGKVIIKPQG
jgi:NADPH2:quinone reductase